MPDNIQSAMLEILKRVQSDVVVVKTDVAEIKVRVERLETRVERIEELAKKHRPDSAAMLVMMRATAGVFDERLAAVELDVRLLKERRP